MRSIRTFRDDDHRIADCIIGSRTTRRSVTTEEEQLPVGQTCWLAVAENEPSTHTRPRKETANVHLTGCPDENACGCAVRSRDYFHRPDIDGYACACVRRVRSERPSRSVGRLQIWRQKCGFRANAATDSEGKRPHNPIECGHLIRTKAATLL